MLKPKNTPLPYTNTNTRAHRGGERPLHSWAARCLPASPVGAAEAPALSFFACTWELAQHFSLLSIILIAQHDSSALNPPNTPTSTPGQMAFFFFFFFLNCLWALLHLCSATTLNKSPGRLGGRGGESGGSSVQTNGFGGSRANKTD